MIHTHTHAFLSRYRKLIFGTSVVDTPHHCCDMSVVRWCPHDALLCTTNADMEIQKMNQRKLRRYKHRKRQSTRNFDKITGESKKKFWRLYPKTEVYNSEGLYIAVDKFKKSDKEWYVDLINHKQY